MRIITVRSSRLVADPEPLVESLVAGIALALELVDLRAHDGVHPRVGAVDVVPIVPLVPQHMEIAKEVAHAVAQRVGTELGVPVFLYGLVGRRPAAGVLPQRWAGGASAPSGSG